ncbi:Arm DNA-binding domain-containing protein [Dyella lipolytica]|uniref:Arm DNA-binding domain-containing protein n=1 Tax=Dyella lipolytica TaxID=1867835 RepID=UPI0024E103B1|nr:Arm DNA-binding domain-containing protein [Dyella lipolytica]
MNPNGSKWWRRNYRIAGKRKTLSMGTYPETTLAEARGKHAAARRVAGAGD